MTPQLALGMLSELVERAGPGIHVFWLQLSEGSRSDFASEVERARGRLPVVPLVLQGGGLFASADSVPSDLASLLAANRSRFEGLSATHGLDQVAVLILSRVPFDLPQIASPVTLPDWFPLAPASEAPLFILDLGGGLDAAALDYADTHREELALRLYELESALLHRLRTRLLDGHVSGTAFPGLFGLPLAASELGAALTEASSYLARVSEPRSYRPSTRSARSLLARLVNSVVTRTPDQLPTAGESLIEALGLATASNNPRPALFAVMFRPGNRPGPAGETGMALLLATYAAYQLTTAAAHAAEYPRFPADLLAAVSRDIRRTLAAYTEWIKIAPP